MIDMPPRSGPLASQDLRRIDRAHCCRCTFDYFFDHDTQFHGASKCVCQLISAAVKSVRLMERTSQFRADLDRNCRKITLADGCHGRWFCKLFCASDLMTAKHFHLLFAFYHSCSTLRLRSHNVIC